MNSIITAVILLSVCGVLHGVDPPNALPKDFAVYDGKILQLALAKGKSLADFARELGQTTMFDITIVEIPKADVVTGGPPDVAMTLAQRAFEVSLIDGLKKQGAAEQDIWKSSILKAAWQVAAGRAQDEYEVQKGSPVGFTHAVPQKLH